MGDVCNFVNITVQLDILCCFYVCRWEGGNRLVGAIRGPGIKQRGPEFGLMHGADWMPSLLRFDLHRQS